MNFCIKAATVPADRYDCNHSSVDVHRNHSPGAVARKPKIHDPTPQKRPETALAFNRWTPYGTQMCQWTTQI